MDLKISYNLFLTSAIMTSALILAPNTFAVYTPTVGDIIKTATNPAVYYIGPDNKRHLYVNEATFWTWHTGSWSKIQSNGKEKLVKTITQDDFDAIDAGSNATVRPGSGIIRFENSQELYKVTENETITSISSTDAEKLFGSTWQNKVIAIQAGFESNYRKYSSSPMEKNIIDPDLKAAVFKPYVDYRNAPDAETYIDLVLKNSTSFPYTSFTDAVSEYYSKMKQNLNRLTKEEKTTLLNFLKESIPTVDDINIIAVTVTDNKATVDYEFSQKSGIKSEISQEMIKEDGKWIYGELASARYAGVIEFVDTTEINKILEKLDLL